MFYVKEAYKFLKIKIAVKEERLQAIEAIQRYVLGFRIQRKEEFFKCLNCVFTNLVAKSRKLK